MSTDVTQNPQTPTAPQGNNPNSGEALANLANALGSVDPKAPDAQANASSISDNNGGRIELNQDKIEIRADTPVIKK